MASCLPSCAAVVLFVSVLLLPDLAAARLGDLGDVSGINASTNQSGVSASTTLSGINASTNQSGNNATANGSALDAAARNGSSQPSFPMRSGANASMLLGQSARASESAENVQAAAQVAGTGNWSNMSLEAEASTFSGLHYGFQWSASTTRYGNAGMSSCGGLNTATTVEGTGYYAVASSQAMQSAFLWGASCCYCGSASRGQSALGTAPMGCFSCARGRFLNRSPHVGHRHASGFATGEIKVVVLDVCPGDSTGWCQPHPGDVNKYGEKNHLDFCIPPSGINNNFFVFTPEECSPELQRRMAPGRGKCQRGGI